MHFLTDEESGAWVAALGYTLAPPALPSVAAGSLAHVRVRVPSDPARLLAFTRALSGFLAPRASCLLWVVTWGVWASSENWHLYYRLRQSYGDRRQLGDAPGHLFLDYEEPDLVSYLELALLSGWDVHVLPELTYGEPETARVFMSHDGWVALAHREPGAVEQQRGEFAEIGYEILESLAVSQPEPGPVRRASRPAP